MKRKKKLFIYIYSVESYEMCKSQNKKIRKKKLRKKECFEKLII